MSLSDAGESLVLVADLGFGDSTIQALDLDLLIEVSQRARVILILGQGAPLRKYVTLLARADGCMTSDEGSAVLADAVDCVLAGGSFVSAGATRLLDSLHPDEMAQRPEAAQVRQGFNETLREWPNESWVGWTGACR